MELREECMPCRSMSLVAAVKPLEMELDTDLPKLARSSIGRSFVAFCEKFFQSANGAAAGERSGARSGGDGDRAEGPRRSRNRPRSASRTRGTRGWDARRRTRYERGALGARRAHRRRALDVRAPSAVVGRGVRSARANFFVHASGEFRPVDDE